MNKQEIPLNMPGYFKQTLEKVASVVNGDEIDIIFQPQFNNEIDWKIAAEMFPEFSDTIRGLGQALARIKPVRMENPRLIAQEQTHFERVQDPFARELLANILVARMCPESGVINPNMNARVESKRMSHDLGLTNGWQDPKATRVTFRTIVGAILTERLPVTYQTPKRARP